MRTVLILLAGVLAGCVKSVMTPAATSIVQTQKLDDVADCRFITEVTGKWGGLGTLSQAEQNLAAQTQALNEAASVGATHVVWTGIQQGSVSSFANAAVYRCP